MSATAEQRDKVRHFINSGGVGYIPLNEMRRVLADSEELERAKCAFCGGGIDHIRVCSACRRRYCGAGAPNENADKEDADG